MNVRVNIYNISSITCIDTYLPIIQVEQRHFQIMKPWNFQLQVGDVDADSGPQSRQFWGPKIGETHGIRIHLFLHRSWYWILLKIFWANNIPSFTPAFLMRPLLNVPKSSSDHVAQGVQMCHWPSPVSKRTAGVTLWSRWKISLKKYLEFFDFPKKTVIQNVIWCREC